MEGWSSRRYDADTERSMSVQIQWIIHKMSLDIPLWFNGSYTTLRSTFRYDSLILSLRNSQEFLLLARRQCPRNMFEDSIELFESALEEPFVTSKRKNNFFSLTRSAIEQETCTREKHALNTMFVASDRNPSPSSALSCLLENCTSNYWIAGLRKHDEPQIRSRQKKNVCTSNSRSRHCSRYLFRISIVHRNAFHAETVLRNIQYISWTPLSAWCAGTIMHWCYKRDLPSQARKA